MNNDHLDQLEQRSVHILREAYAAFNSLGMLWSIGKDSTVLLWLARKAFFGHVPFPLIHIDTAFKIPAMIAYRDRVVAEWNLHLIYGQNEAALVVIEGGEFPGGAGDENTFDADVLQVPEQRFLALDIQVAAGLERHQGC